MTLRILVTNDDGIDAPGLKVLEEIAHKIVDKNGIVVTVAPAIDQSGVGHSISYLRPTLISRAGVNRFSVEGSPADCVLAGIHHVMKDHKPDLVLSGINNGHNLAEDILYSGTVGAAMEGALQGIKSIAISQCYSKESILFDDRFESARQLGASVCKQLIIHGVWTSKYYQTFYNVNFPAARASDTKGLSFCKQGKRENPSFSMEQIVAPNGRTFLMVNHKPGNKDAREQKKYKIDIEMIKQNYVTVTPLKADLTLYDEFTELEKNLENAI